MSDGNRSRPGPLTERPDDGYSDDRERFIMTCSLTDLADAMKLLRERRQWARRVTQGRAGSDRPTLRLVRSDSDEVPA